MTHDLDKIDKRILAALELNARIVETALAKSVGKSRESVHYRIKMMEESGVIVRYTCIINVAKIGYQGYKVYLKLKGNPERRTEFFDHIRSRSDIFWFGVADGAWNVGLTFFATDNEIFYNEKNRLFSKFNDIILDRSTGALVEPIFFGKKFLHEEKRFAKATESQKPIHTFGKIAANHIDQIDRKILASLLRNGRIRLVELAKRVGQNVDMVRGRMKRLENLGIIAAYTTDIDYNKLGMEFYKAFVYFDSITPKDEAMLYEFAKEHPNIVNMVRQISPWDVELEIMVTNYRSYNEIINQIKEMFPTCLRNIETAIMGGDYVFPAQKTIFD